MTTSRNVPVNQSIRVNVLRLAFLAALPLVVLSHPSLPDAALGGLEIAGIALVITAVLGRFWAILYIGGRKNRTIVQQGPYSICRHPLYLFSIIGVIGFAMMLGSVVLTAVLGGITFVILSITAIKEEGFLRHEFGPAYEAYSARVPMILPRLSGFQTDDTITVSVAHLRQNLKDALVFLCFIPLAKVLGYIKKNDVVPTFPLW